MASNIDLVSIYQRRYFSKAAINNETFDYASLDAQLADLIFGHNSLTSLLRQVTTASGTLRYSPVSRTTFTATAAQTAFTVPAYSTTNDYVVAFTNSASGNLSMIAPGSTTATSSTVVTIPAQSTGATVVVEVWSPGNGTTQLASTTSGQGATLVGIVDAGAFTAQTTVEGALQEIYGEITGASGVTYLNGLLTMTQYLAKAGGTMTGDITFSGGVTAKGLRASAANGEAVRHEQLQAVITQLNGTSSTFLAKTGGTMSGAIDMGSSKITSLATPTAAADASTKGYVDTTLASFGGLPVGTVVAYAGASDPTGWLNCDGSAVARATYVSLFAVLGTGFGVGDGVTTFNIPDLRGRCAIGVGTGVGLTARALNAQVGVETYALVTGELPSHNHTVGVNNSAGGAGTAGIFDTITAPVATGTINTSLTGSGTAHQNMQPSLGMRYIIKT